MVAIRRGHKDMKRPIVTATVLCCFCALSMVDMAEVLDIKSIAESWGPGLVGLILSACMYGTGFGQSVFYFYYFPDDHTLLKLAVLSTLALDTIHVYGCVQLYWQVLITCRRDTSSECSNQLPMGFVLAVLVNYIITFIVQCFYAQRVWIVTGRHKLITTLTVFTAVADFVVGLVCAAFTAQQLTVQYIFTTPLVAYSAALSTVCDITLTSSIVYFLRAGRSGQKLQPAGVVQQLRRVSINCGLLTCIVSLMTVLFYFIQGNKYWVEITGVVLSRSYINSMLSALNARKSMRDREQDCRDLTIEIPSIHII